MVVKLKGVYAKAFDQVTEILDGIANLNLEINPSGRYGTVSDIIHAALKGVSHCAKTTTVVYSDPDYIADLESIRQEMIEGQPLHLLVLHLEEATNRARIRCEHNIFASPSGYSHGKFGTMHHNNRGLTSKQNFASYIVNEVSMMKDGYEHTVTDPKCQYTAYIEMLTERYQN